MTNKWNNYMKNLQFIHSSSYTATLLFSKKTEKGTVYDTSVKKSMPQCRMYLYQKYELHLCLEFHFISLCVVTSIGARYLQFCYRTTERLRLEGTS